MTATDELRRLLDERGVEYYKHEDGEPLRELHEGRDDATSWRVGVANVCAVPFDDYTFDLWIDHATPEQAIAATLGRGTCEYCNGAMPIPYQYADGFSGWIEIVIDSASLFVQVGYDELAIPINYCPICGRKVKQ